MKRSRTRASVLISVMMIVAMLLAFVLALQYFEGTSRRALLYDEAQLYFRESYRFSLQQEVCRPDQLVGVKAPSHPEVGASGQWAVQANKDNPPLHAFQTAKVFTRPDGLPNLRPSDTASVGFDPVAFTPQPDHNAYDVFQKNNFTAVLNSLPGYAVYAPKGSLDIYSLVGWANPDFKDKRESAQAYSGVRSWVAAKNDIKLEYVKYAEAYTTSGEIAMPVGGVAFKRGQFPYPDYSTQIRDDIVQARQALMTKAMSSGNKTGQLIGSRINPIRCAKIIFDGISEGIQDSAGDGAIEMERFLSIQASAYWWLPTIPTFNSYPPYYYQLNFHVPEPPDLVTPPKDDTKDKTSMDATFKAQKERIDSAQAKKKQADADLAADPKNSDKQKAATDAQKELDGVFSDSKAENDKLKADSENNKQSILSQLKSNLFGVPASRSKDPEGTQGQYGWHYGFIVDLFRDIGSIISTLSSNPSSDVLFKIGQNDEVKLLHFGGKKRKWKFDFSGSDVKIGATLNVPRGRSLYFKTAGDMTIKGDLWLQRGSTLYADCSTLKFEVDSDYLPNKFFSPTGRIFMEEGSSLVCSGTLKVAGTSTQGCVIVGGVPTKTHPISAAIFAKNIQLDYGITPGTSLDDLLEGYTDNNTLLQLNEHLVRPLFAKFAPNVAKALGPFYARRPYFAQYATVIEIICPPLPPFGEPGPPIPLAIPLPIPNVMNKISRALATVYSVNMNFGLGENFVTHCPWWIFGEGRVPMVPQIDPDALKDAFGNLGGFAGAIKDSVDPGKMILAFIADKVSDAIRQVIQTVVVELTKKILAAAIPYGGIVDAAADMAGQVASQVEDRLDAAANVSDALVHGLTGSNDDPDEMERGPLRAIEDKLSSAFQEKYMRLYNGVLVYADDDITIKGSGGVASGMFVAGGNISIASKYCIGTVMSLTKDVKIDGTMLYYPYFSRASLFKPRDTGNTLYTRGVDVFYDSDTVDNNTVTNNPSNYAVDVGPPALAKDVSVQGWTK